MSDHPVWSIVAALAAAAMFAVAAVAQQRAAAAIADDEPLVGSLVRNPRWLAGIGADAGGYGLQVAALALGPVLIVQPLLVTALVFALPLSARIDGRRVAARTWCWAVLLIVALAAFLLVGAPTAGNPSAPLRDWLAPLAVLLGGILVAVLLASAARRTSDGTGARAALLFGAAGGALFGVTAALTDFVAGRFAHGLDAVVSSWQTWALIAAGLAGVYLQQRAFQAGSLTAALPAATVAEPLAAAFLGLTVLDESLRTDGLALVVVPLTVIVLCAAAVALARAEAAE
ncbi:DMT family transporter [Nocardia shimofusensis]|uniref:DMT family transporter n=1 Tax=Nocardia shimofusensis TaxID=228596 RepID=UPI000A93FA90|nr:DMT family transporter [Nocardia shimofusensis]